MAQILRRLGRYIRDTAKKFAKFLVRFFTSKCALFTDWGIPCIIGMKYEGVPKVSGLAAWSENCKWYSCLPLGAVVSLFCESV
jgi:hypothetical protein